MYEMDGEFGKVRMVTHTPGKKAEEAFCCVQAAGWHLCNDKYHIERQRMHNSFLLLITVSGEGYGEIDREHFSLRPGTVLLLPPDLPIQYHTPTGGLWEFYWIHAGGEPAFRLLRHCIENKGYFFDFSREEAARELVEDCLRIYRDQLPEAELRISAKLSAFLHLLAAGGQEDGGESLSPLTAQTLRYLQGHYGEKISLAALGQKLFVSPAHIIRLFRADTGETPYEYLIRYRMEKAKELLQYTPLLVREISFMVGYNQVSNFTACFKKMMGEPPQKYRSRRFRRSIAVKA